MFGNKKRIDELDQAIKERNELREAVEAGLRLVSEISLHLLKQQRKYEYGESNIDIMEPNGNGMLASYRAQFEKALKK